MSRIMSISTYEKDSNNNSILVNHPIGTTTSQIDYIDSQSHVSGNLTDKIIEMDEQDSSLKSRVTSLENKVGAYFYQSSYSFSNGNNISGTFYLYHKDPNNNPIENLFFYTIELTITGGASNADGFVPISSYPILKRFHAQAPLGDFYQAIYTHNSLTQNVMGEKFTILKFKEGDFNIYVDPRIGLESGHSEIFYGSGEYIGNFNYS